jgi:hypothetical protein
MKHIWSILCRTSSIDFESNSLSLFECIEEINLTIDKTKIPLGEKMIIPAEFQLVSFWIIKDNSRDNAIELKGELVDPNGKVLNSFKNSHEIKKGALRFRSRINIQGLPTTEEGRYYFKVWQKVNGEKDFELISELPLDIKISYQLLEVVKK